MKLTQDHFDLVASVLAKLPTDANGHVKIDPDALSDRFANAMAPYAPSLTAERHAHFVRASRPDDTCPCKNTWHQAWHNLAAR